MTELELAEVDHLLDSFFYICWPTLISIRSWSERCCYLNMMTSEMSDYIACSVLRSRFCWKLKTYFTSNWAISDLFDQLHGAILFLKDWRSSYYQVRIAEGASSNCRKLLWFPGMAPLNCWLCLSAKNLLHSYECAISPVHWPLLRYLDEILYIVNL